MGRGEPQVDVHTVSSAFCQCSIHNQQNLTTPIAGHNVQQEVLNGAKFWVRRYGLMVTLWLQICGIGIYFVQRDETTYHQKGQLNIHLIGIYIQADARSYTHDNRSLHSVLKGTESYILPTQKLVSIGGEVQGSR